ncbi:hypothetical protein HAX54_033028 [Datura stramonium]|uniref:Uncharacterized protein n=1 Tax=Datura stramonium TaxID=4076 RepID=A0ABS8VE54_DATST|nr:hypothetical protein [Datura stramonium]
MGEITAPTRPLPSVRIVKGGGYIDACGCMGTAFPKVTPVVVTPSSILSIPPSPDGCAFALSGGLHNRSNTGYFASETAITVCG